MTHANLWAPWRMEYMNRLIQDEKSSCFLCDAWAHPDRDDEQLVVWRSRLSMIILNRYPYTNGHLLVAPADHLSDLTDLTGEQRADLMETSVFAERLIRLTLNPQGINMGLNLGRCAGAGLPGHVHMHVVPRWGGDTNFMQVVGRVRVIPQANEAILREFKAALPKVI